MLRTVYLLPLLLVALAAPRALAQATTQPSRIEQLVSQLADPDAEVREKARVELMDIDSDELPRLRAAVESLRPLAPAQTTALKDIVVHVYARGIDYPRSHSGFLGIVWEPLVDPFKERDQLVVGRRLPGFCAFRVFCEGDVLLGMASPMEVQFTSQNSVGTAISACRPGSTIELDVLRRGRVVRIEVTLDAKPAGANPLEEAARRVFAGEEYWEKHFEPLMREEMTGTQFPMSPASSRISG
jgi:S1-C subfamily serine protease